jgi:ABC-type microcin C transport system duplicated ATPase subunit YejF
VRGSANAAVRSSPHQLPILIGLLGDRARHPSRNYFMHLPAVSLPCSTLAALLLGLYEPTSGEILVDGRPLSSLDGRWWRAQLGVVMQDPGLLRGSVRDIITYGYEGPGDEEIMAAAAAAQATGFVERMGGLDALVDSGSLSGGQRQRLAIARALIRRPKLLVLDEVCARERAVRMRVHIRALMLIHACAWVFTELALRIVRVLQTKIGSKMGGLCFCRHLTAGHICT